MKQKFSSEEHNEDLSFDVSEIANPYFNCGMMLNGVYYIFKLTQVNASDDIMYLTYPTFRFYRIHYCMSI